MKETLSSLKEKKIRDFSKFRDKLCFQMQRAQTKKTLNFLKSIQGFGTNTNQNTSRRAEVQLGSRCLASLGP